MQPVLACTIDDGKISIYVSLIKVYRTTGVYVCVPVSIDIKINVIVHLIVGAGTMKSKSASRAHRPAINNSVAMPVFYFDLCRAITVIFHCEGT